MLIILYLVFFLYLFRRYLKFKSPILNFVFLFYMFASGAAIFTHYVMAPNAYHTILSVVFHLLILYLCISPIIKFAKYQARRSFRLLDDNRFKILAYSLILLQLFSITYFAQEDVAMLLRGDFSQIRSEILASERGTGSIFRTIAGVGSYYYCYNMILFFYSLAFRKDRKIFLILLMVSSVSRVFHSLTYMGRDGILFWLLSFVVSYFIFKPYIKNEASVFLRKIFISIGGLSIFLFLAISVSRFGDSDNGVFYSLIDYFGQPINNFGVMFHQFHDYSGTKTVLPLLYGEKGISGGDVLADTDYFMSKYGFANNSFKTFVGSFYMAWGPVFTTIMALIYSVVMVSQINRCRDITIPAVIVLMISIQIVIHNYFYWAYYIGVANLFLFTTPVFLIWCSKSSGVKVDI